MDTYKLIDLNEYVQTGEGGSSLTYTHKTRNALAKLFNPGAEAEMAEREFMTSRSVFDMGIPTPEPYQLITDGKRRGVEYELIKNKRSFTRIISEEPSRLEEISLAFARMTRELHATKADTSRIPSVKDILRNFYLEKDLVTEEYKQRALAFLDKAPDSTNCLHGDLHIGNIITDEERVLWIDLGMFCYGVPEWDLGWTWTMCNRIDDKRADFILHLTPEVLNAHWNIFLPAYLGTNDRAAIGEYIKRILPFYAVKLPYMFDMVLQSRLPDEALKALPQVIV